MEENRLLAGLACFFIDPKTLCPGPALPSASVQWSSYVSHPSGKGLRLPDGQCCPCFSGEIASQVALNSTVRSGVICFCKALIHLHYVLEKGWQDGDPNLFVRTK